MCLVMILVMKVFIFSKTMIICLLCPLLCGLFFFWKGAKGELSYKAMKGIASNLEFTHLQQKSAKAVDMIRAGQREEVLPVIGKIEKEYQKVIEQIQKLD